MVTLDRRKLTAPLLAQAAAFVVVLAIGIVGGHGGKVHPVGPSPSATPSKTVRTTPSGPVSTTPQGNTPTPADSTELRLVIAQVDNFGVVMPSLTVDVFTDNRAMTLVLSAHLPAGTAGTPEILGSVPAGHEYQVCVEPPHDWTFTDQSTNARRGWDCAKVDAISAAKTIPFHLLPLSPTTGTVT